MTTAIEPRKAADVSVWDYVQMEPSGLVFRDSITYEVWCDLGAQLQDLERRIMWMIGDWLAFGEAKYGEKYTQALEATDYAQQTLRNAVWVANAKPTTNHTRRNARPRLTRGGDAMNWWHSNNPRRLPCVATGGVFRVVYYKCPSLAGYELVTSTATDRPTTRRRRDDADRLHGGARVGYARPTRRRRRRDE